MKRAAVRRVRITAITLLILIKTTEKDALAALAPGIFNLYFKGFWGVERKKVDSFFFFDKISHRNII